jgi:hypothetical protein
MAGFQKHINTLNTPIRTQRAIEMLIETREISRKATIPPIETPPIATEATNAALDATSAREIGSIPFITRERSTVIICLTSKGIVL